MQNLYYSVIGAIAIILHVLINHEMFSKPKQANDSTTRTFHYFLLSVLFYFITDALWGLIAYTKNVPLLYADTVAYYIAMSLSVVSCCQYIISFLSLNRIFKVVLVVFSVLFLGTELLLLGVNFLFPVFFWFDSNGVYHAAEFRYTALIIQIIMFASITLVSLIVVIRKTVKSDYNRRSVAVCLFALTMTVTILAQAFYPLLPLYTIGLVIGICILHVFVQEDIKNEQFEVLKAMSEIFYSLHVIDLNTDTVGEFNSKDYVKKIVNRRDGAAQMMKQVINTVTQEEYLEAALEFTDLTTVRQRMGSAPIISRQFKGKNIGWFLATFVAVEAEKDGTPAKVIFATRVIDEEKRAEEKLIRKTQTDEMTGLLNRRAYEEEIYAHNDRPEEENFIYVSLDVNGLKVVNDSIGHTAGDELLIGACHCMKTALGPHGKLFRIGGDEFVATLFCKDEEIAEILKTFDETIAGWSGKLIDSLSISYGWINKKEMPEASVRQLGAVAEKRMYEAKSAHYRKTGVDRRGQQDAHKALCEAYTKILRINVTEDSYQIINMDTKEQTKEKGFAESISKWLCDFGKSGQVHPEDLDEYLKLTDLQYIRDYFKGNKTSLHIFYRRKYDDGFKSVMMEMIPASDYSAENQSLFLYVKDIDR